MNILTNERLIKIASWRETYGANASVMIPAEEAEELVQRLLTAETKLAGLYAQKPFMHGIADPDGTAYFDECCVGDLGLMNEQVATLNDDLDEGAPRYSVVALYREPVPDEVADRIKPVLPVRDAFGFWRHPNRIETPFDEGGAPTRDYIAWFAERGMEVDFVYMNQVFCDDCVYGEYVERPALHWNPESPFGEGWILTAIFETEEGPCAEWVRYKDGDA